FGLVCQALRRGMGKFLHDPELKLYFTIIAVSTIAVSAGLSYGGLQGSAAAIQTVSIMTTTGFVTADSAAWPLFCKMILFSLMFVGACSSSAGGGLKVVRVLMVFKLMGRGVFVRLHPNAVVSIKLYDQTMPGDMVSKAASFVFLYAVVFFAGSLLVSFDTPDLVSGVSAAASSLGNIGPMLCEAGMSTDYTVFSPFSKLVLSLLMVLGRLELFTPLILFTPGFWHPGR
ncbi:MAG: TrkH family potassium uptake protein, partial [Clostridiales bacterium]|nr:TrkH family potassium uptake protein [Clostridiales bacterium]